MARIETAKQRRRGPVALARTGRPGPRPGDREARLRHRRPDRRLAGDRRAGASPTAPGRRRSSGRAARPTTAAAGVLYLRVDGPRAIFVQHEIGQIMRTGQRLPRLCRRSARSGSSRGRSQSRKPAADAGRARSTAGKPRRDLAGTRSAEVSDERGSRGGARPARPRRARLASRQADRDWRRRRNAIIRLCRSADLRQNPPFPTSKSRSQRGDEIPAIADRRSRSRWSSPRRRNLLLRQPAGRDAIPARAPARPRPRRARRAT